MTVAARLGGAVVLVVAAVLFHLALVQPAHPGALTWRALGMVPLELPLVLGGLFALGRRGRGVALAAALLLTAMGMIKTADFASQTVFGRPWDPVTDLGLLPAGVRLLRGAAGLWATVALAAALVLVLVVAAAALTWAGRRWAAAGAASGPGWRLAAGGAALAAAALSAVEVRTDLNRWQGWNPPGDAFTLRLGAEHVRDALASRAAFADFARAAAADSFARREGLFARLKGRDVAIVFIESYGRGSFDTPAYAALLDPTRAAGAAELRRQGLDIRSGWLSSPVEGGQSWLAHATLASGLRIGDQRRYRAIVASARLTLYDLAMRAGYATLAAEPAIVLPWPEGRRLGFETTLAAADLGYRGRPFNWVTMPDQFTLAAVDRLAPRGRPLMAEIALISSHAPWTPVPHMLPWEEVGDGRAFDEMATAGPAPAEVWADRDRIRAHYAATLDYSLQAVLSWAALPRADPPLLVVLGDHQPVAFVARSGGTDVPVHLIGPPEMLALFDGWGWTAGPTPAAALAPWPMESFRDRFLDAVSDPVEQGS